MHLLRPLITRRITNFTIRPSASILRRVAVINSQRDRLNLLFSRRRKGTRFIARSHCLFRCIFSRFKERTRHQLIRTSSLQTARRNSHRHRRLLLTTKRHTNLLRAAFLRAERTVMRNFRVTNRALPIISHVNAER